VAHLTGAFSEKISRAADDTVLSLISLAVVSIATIAGLVLTFVVIQFIIAN
jgi:hypothetical protein